MARPIIQSIIDRLRLIVQAMGWEVITIDTSGPEIRIILTHPKPE